MVLKPAAIEQTRILCVDPGQRLTGSTRKTDEPLEGSSRCARAVAMALDKGQPGSSELPQGG